MQNELLTSKAPVVESFPSSWKFGLVPWAQKNVWFGIVLPVLPVCLYAGPSGLVL